MFYSNHNGWARAGLSTLHSPDFVWSAGFHTVKGYEVDKEGHVVNCVWLAETKLFPVWSFTEEVCRPLASSELQQCGWVF